MTNSFIPAGRERLISQLSLLAGRPGSRVLVTGEPGIGKTFVLERALQPVTESSSVRVLHARGHSSDFTLAYQGLHDLFAEVSLEALPIPELQRSILSVVLLRSTSETDVSASAVAVAVDSALAVLATTAHLVLVIDDIDRMDAETSSLLGYVMTRPGERARNFSVIASATTALFTNDRGLTIQRFPATDVIQIGPLRADDLVRAVGSVSDRRISSLQGDLLHTQSLGNPTCAIEILSLSQGVDAPQLAKTDADALIGMRLGEIDEAARAILAVCALTPNPTSGQVTQGLHLRASDIPALVDRGLVRLLDGRLFPVHDLFARAALDGLPTSRLTQMHASLAETASDPGTRAHHLDRSQPAGVDDSLSDDLAEAALGMRRRGVPGSETDFLLRSMTRTRPDHPAFAERAIRVGELLHQRGEYSRCLAVLTTIQLETVELALFDRAVLPLLSSAAATHGELDAIGRISALREAVGDDRLRSAMLDIAQAVVDGSDLNADRTRSALRTLDATEDAPLTLRRGLGALVHARINSGQGLDDALLDRIAELEERMPSMPVADSAEAFRGMHAYQVGRFDESRRALQTARRRALDAGEPIAAGRFAIHLATIDVLTGRAAQANALLDERDAVDPWPESSPPPLLAVRGMLALMHGGDAELDTVLGEPAGQVNPKKDELYRLALRGQRAARRSDWADAVIYLTSARDLSESIGVREPGARLHLDFPLARAFIARGRIDEALSVIESLEQLPGDRPLVAGVVLRLRGLIAAHDSRLSEAERLLRESVLALPRDSHRGEVCLSLLELANLLLRTVANRAEATSLLTEAENAAVSAEDNDLATRVRYLRAVAETPSFVDVLTPREQVVALAAGAGTSNREIAAENFISVRTVETQLSSVYRKLGLRSRSDLMKALHQISPNTHDSSEATG